MTMPAQQPVSEPAPATPATPQAPAPVTPPAQPPATPPPATPPAPVNVTVPPNATTVRTQDASADFARRYDQLRGTFLSAQSQWDQRDGFLTAQNQQLTAQVRQLTAQIAQLTAQQGVLQQQVQEIPNIQQQASHVSNVTAENQRLRQVLQFPAIINQARNVETQDEQGNAVTQQQNPVLDLVLSSSLQGDDFVRMLSDLSQTLPGAAPPGSQPPPANPLQMTTTPPSPVSTTNIDSLRQQRDAARDAGDWNQVNSLQDQIMMELGKQPT